MDKESRQMLQKIDCNCSDCKFMKRNLVRRQYSVDLHYKWQKEHFDTTRIKLLLKAKEWFEKGDIEKSSQLVKDARKLRFEFNEGECALHYGYCLKKDTEVSFIPNYCDLETKKCFMHRNVMAPEKIKKEL